MTATNKQISSAFRQRLYIFPGTTSTVAVYGNDPAPNGTHLVYDHWISTTSETVDYANQDGANPPAPSGAV
jgi:hypothetical protein